MNYWNEATLKINFCIFWLFLILIVMLAFPKICFNYILYGFCYCDKVK